MIKMPEKVKGEAKEAGDLSNTKKISFDFKSFEDLEKIVGLIERLVMDERLAEDQYKAVSSLAYALRKAKSQEYKGYRNCATWLVVEAIHNSPELDFIWQEYAEQAIKSGKWTMSRGNFTLEDAINYDLTELLKHHFGMIVERLDLPWKARRKNTDGRIVKEIREAESGMLRAILLNTSDIDFPAVAAKLIKEARIRLEDAEAEDAVVDGRSR